MVLRAGVAEEKRKSMMGLFGLLVMTVLELTDLWVVWLRVAGEGRGTHSVRKQKSNKLRRRRRVAIEPYS